MENEFKVGDRVKLNIKDTGAFEPFFQMSTGLDTGDAGTIRSFEDGGARLDMDKELPERCKTDIVLECGLWVAFEHLEPAPIVA